MSLIIFSVHSKVLWRRNKKSRKCCCIAGFLGGLAPLKGFMPLIQIPGSVKLTSFGSAFVFGKKDFTFSEIPMQKIISDIEQRKIQNILAATFLFEQVADAHILMETNTVNLSNFNGYS